MKTLVLLSAFLGCNVHASPLSWPREAVMQIEHAKTVRDITCVDKTTKSGRELCELFGTAGGAQKNGIKIERVNDAILKVKAGATSVLLERTEKYYEYKLNDQLIDLRKYPTQERLSFAIDAVLARGSGSAGGKIYDGSLFAALAFVESANAQAIDPSIKPAVQGLMVMSTLVKSCETYQTFIKTCLENTDDILKYLKDNTANYTAEAKKQTKDKIDKKIDGVVMALARVDGQIDANYRNALLCDCNVDKGQVACTKPPGPLDGGKVAGNLTKPAQTGLDRCQRLLKEINDIPNARDFQVKETAKKLLEKTEQHIADIKAEGSGQGSSSK